MNQINAGSDYDTVLYRVKAGDTLGSILKNYHSGFNSSNYQALTSQVLRDNSEITNPNYIYPDQLIELTVPRQYCAAPNNFTGMRAANDVSLIPTIKKEWKHADREHKDMLASLTPLYIGGTIGLGVSSTALGGLNQLLQSNSPLLTEMAKLYESYKAGDLTKGQYDYRRRKLISQLHLRLGSPAERILFGSSSPSEVLRVQRGNTVNPTKAYTSQAARMTNMAKWASRGGVLLTGASLAMACSQIGNENDRNKKNKVFVEAIGGVGSGLLYGAAVSIGVVIMATPVGWGAALIIGAGSVIAGYAGGKIASSTYDRFGNKVDLVNASGVEIICK